MIFNKVVSFQIFKSFGRTLMDYQGFSERGIIPVNTRTFQVSHLAAMSTPKHTNHPPEETPQVGANWWAEKSAIKAGVEVANAEYVDYLKQMIASLLENQMNLSAALDETREACAQLNLQKSELEASSTQEVQVLQAELSMCRQREAEMALAYEDLRSRVEAIDQVIEQIPWLDVLFNSDDPLPARLKALKCEDEDVETGVTASEPRVSQTSANFRSASYDADADADDDDDDEADIDVVEGDVTPHHHQVPLSAWHRSKRTGSASPLSDSGCTSESHDEISLASLNSTHSSPHLAVLRRRLEAQQQQQQQNGEVRMRRSLQHAPLKRSATSAIVSGGGSRGKEGWRLGRITESLRASISRFADKSEWKMEALAARQREARALVLLNETQAEVRKVESRCKGLTRRQNEQELRMNEKEKEIERLLSQERELRNDLRNWQQRVFQLEAETQEIRHNCQIAELEMKSRLLEASMLAADPTAKATLHNPASLFSEDVIRVKVTDETTTPTTTTPSTATITTPAPVSLRGLSHEDASRPPKFSRPSLQGRPQFASTTSLSRLSLASSSQTQKNTSGMSRPASSLQLNHPSGSSGGVSCRGRSSILTTSFGSLSELELTSDV
uniref:Expressed conserved protein n=1 Tax=Echinococcus granulosus TaxID=6210 RepID=A0A068WRJ3_ECHGR|nr:expressed conserved protein [Echinococcus granulosus]